MESKSTNESQPIINCHVHTFTGDHVPPFLAKTFLPWPFYYLVPVSLVVWIARFWFNTINRKRFKPTFIRVGDFWYKVKVFFRRSFLLNLIYFIVGGLLTIKVFFILFDWCSSIFGIDESTTKGIKYIKDTIENIIPGFIASFKSYEILIVLALFIFFKPSRNIVFFALKSLFSIFRLLPGPKSKELIKRYFNIGRFAFHRKQRTIFTKLSFQYPEGTGFIVLPMDMEYMAAGKLNEKYVYSKQMEELAILKKTHPNTFFPFVFAEPRRMVAEGNAHFAYSIVDGKVKLEDNCFINQYINLHKFSGFKIYPALGYYPFDETLLPLWKYAADNGLPIMTHCIRGTIFYRGTKKKEWDFHPIFQEPKGKGVFEPMLLKEIKNIDFINNFTHPLNYLCLLDEKLLRIVVGQSKCKQVKELFGYTNPTTSLKQNLSHLKLCFGHYGGDDEWTRFFELDRDNLASQIMKSPEKGIDFFPNNPQEISFGKLNQVWKSADWYSITTSIMLQYDHVYADISYIVHNANIVPLLKHTLLNDKLKEKVLFGTDFYVVRNHSSEKQMLMELQAHLSESEMNQITRVNPVKFLSK